MLSLLPSAVHGRTFVVKYAVPRALVIFASTSGKSIRNLSRSFVTSSPTCELPSSSSSRGFTASKDQTSDPRLHISTRLKHVLKKYGPLALGLHCSVYAVTYVSMYKALELGFDMGPFLENLPFDPQHTIKVPPPPSFQHIDPEQLLAHPTIPGLANFVLQELLTPDARVRVVMSWCLTQIIGPIRGVMTLAGTPVLARFLSARAKRTKATYHSPS
eukprot:g6486.t1